jgi:hypothetical protein
MIERYDPNNETPFVVQCDVDEHGRKIVPAFTLQRAHDGKYIYWIVNLHEMTLGDNSQGYLQFFHERAEAERFIEQHKGRQQ